MLLSVIFPTREMPSPPPRNRRAWWTSSRRERIPDDLARTADRPRFLRPLHKEFLKDGGHPARFALARRSINEDFPPLTDDEAKALVNSVNWYHSFELRPRSSHAWRVRLPRWASLLRHGCSRRPVGRRDLDIGTSDGPMAFELRRQGAEVVALDIQDPQEGRIRRRPASPRVAGRARSGQRL